MNKGLALLSCVFVLFFRVSSCAQVSATQQKIEIHSYCDLLLDSIPKTPWALRAAALRQVEVCVLPSSVSEARLCRQYALFHFNGARYKEAIDWAKKEQTIYEKLGEKRKALSAALISTQFYMSFGDNFRAYRIAKGILEQACKAQDTVLMGSANLAMGMCSPDKSIKKRHYYTAINFFNLASHKDKASLGTTHNNLGNLYEDLNNLDSAAYHYQKALEYKKSVGGLTGYAFNTVSNLTRICIAAQKYEQAKDYLEASFANATNLNNETGYYYIPLIMRQVELEIQTAKLPAANKALQHLDSMMLAHRPYNASDWFEYFKLHKTLAFQENNLRSYRNWDNRFVTFVDSMNQHRDSVFNTNLGVLREIETAEAETQQLRKVSQFRIAVIGALLLLLLSLGALVYQLIRQKQLQINNAQQQRILLQQQHTLENLELVQLRTEAELRETQQKSAEARLEQANRELAAYMLLANKKNTFLLDLGELLKQLPQLGATRQEASIQKILHILEQEQSADTEWAHFTKQFEVIHPRFFQLLHQRCDKLTVHDLKLCAFIKMQLDNKDIAKLMSVNPASVLTSRYRLRKKIGLDEQDDLGAYILSI